MERKSRTEMSISELVQDTYECLITDKLPRMMDNLDFDAALASAHVYHGDKGKQPLLNIWAMGDGPGGAGYALIHKLSLLDREQGALEHQRDANGNTAMHWAIQNGQLMKILELRRAGLPFDITNDAGETPIDVVRKAGKADALLQSARELITSQTSTPEEEEKTRFSRKPSDDLILLASLLTENGTKSQPAQQGADLPALRQLGGKVIKNDTPQQGA